MKRIVVASISVLVLSAAFTATAFAKPPSGDSNPSDLTNTTVDDSQIINPNKSNVKPPSGDSNPSDLTNTTVDDSQIVNPHSNR